MSRAASACVAVLLALAAGCGSAGSRPSTPSATTPPSADVLVNAASATRSAGSAHMTMTMVMPSQAGTIHARATGAFLLHGGVRGWLHMVMTVPSAPAPIVMDERMIGTTIYMQSAIFTRLMHGGKPWLSMDLEKLGKQSGVDFGALMNSGQTSDPTQTLTYLQATSSSIENLGSEQVGGVSTTHYHAVVEWDKAEQLMVARAPAAEKAAVRSTYEALKAQTGITSYPVDAWVDGNGLVRQMHMSIPVPTTGSESIDMTIRMSDFGAPVHVSAPPARLVEDFTKLAGR